MNKSILLFLFSLLALVACRSGKTVTQLSNKESVKEKKDSVNKIAASATDTLKNNVNKSVQLSPKEQARVDSIFQALIHDTTKPIVHPTPAEREENRKFAEELKTGIAYSHDPNRQVEYVLIKPIPTVIEKLFPDILIYQERNIMGQGSGSPYVYAIYDEYRVSLPNSIHKLHSAMSNISLQMQMEAILSVMEFPFPVYEVNNITIEANPETYDYLNYRANGKYKEQQYVYRALVESNCIKVFAMYLNEKCTYYLDLRR